MPWEDNSFLLDHEVGDLDEKAFCNLLPDSVGVKFFSDMLLAEPRETGCMENGYGSISFWKINLMDNSPSFTVIEAYGGLPELLVAGDLVGFETDVKYDERARLPFHK